MDYTSTCLFWSIVFWSILVWSISSSEPAMETTTLSTKYQLLPEGIRESLGLKPGQRFLVRATEHRIELIPCEPLSELRGFLSGRICCVAPLSRLRQAWTMG
jgi:hypothetical protein